MIHCYVVDDEEHALQTIANYIEETDGLKLIGTEMNPVNALNQIADGRIRPDITFLDVDMPKISGIDLAGMINHKTAIIFTTAFPTYAVKAFEYAAVDYLVKPIAYPRFLKAVNRVRTSRAMVKEKEAVKEDGAEKYFFIKTNANGALTKILVDDIILVEAKHNYVELLTRTISYLTYLTISETEAELTKNKFVRVQKSYLVNLDMVISIEGNLIRMVNGREIVVGASYRKQFQELISRKALLTKRN